MSEVEQTGIVFWVTGLAGSGKTTLGKALFEKLRAKDPRVLFFDGDELRLIFSEDQTYSVEERRRLALRYAKLCLSVSVKGFHVVCSTISLFREVHAFNRERIHRYFEVFVDCPMEELVRRDQKGLYSKALRGELQNVMGVDLPYDRPKDCDLVIDNAKTDRLEEKVSSILSAAESKFRSNQATFI